MQHLKMTALCIFMTAALLATGTALAEGSKGEPAAEIRGALSISAPDIAKWRQVAPGLYEGYSNRGELTRVYGGAEGRRQYLSTLRSDLMRSEEAARAQDSKSADDARSSASFLAAEIARLEADDAAASTGPKITQEVVTYSAQACTVVYPLRSRFTANFAMVDYPTAEAIMGPAGVGFGPYPPVASQIVRTVWARVGDIANAQQAFDINTSIQASKYQMTFGGSCNMATGFEMSWRCGAGDLQFFALTRTQTCSGVLEGLPPQ